MAELLTVKEAARRAKLSRSYLYPLVTSGEIESVKIGALRRIPDDALDSWIAKLRAAQSGGRAA